MRYQLPTDDYLLNKNWLCFSRRKVTGRLVFKIECALRKQTNPKQTLHCNSVCTFLRKEEINQSQTSISVCIPLAAHVCQLMKSVHGSPCYRFQRGPNLPLEIRQPPPPPFTPSFSLTIFFLSPMQAHTLTHISSCATHSCLGQHIERWLQQWGSPVGQTV